MSLIDSLRQCISSQDMLSTIGQEISEPPQKVASALNAGVPALLACLGSVSSKPEGARAVMSAIQNTDESITLCGPDTFRGGSAASLIEKGGGLISSLLGGQTGDGLISLISKFSGIGLGSARSLISMALPVILGWTGKSATNAGVRDAQGLGGFFASQASAISAAMPSGLWQQMASMPGLSGVAQSLKQAAAPSMAGAAQAAGAAAQQATSSRVWPVVLLLALIGALAWYLWPREEPMPTVQRPTPSIIRNVSPTGELQSEARPAAAKLGQTGEGWISGLSGLSDPALANEITATFSDLGSTLSGIKDDASLSQAKSKLDVIEARVSSWKQTIANLPPEQRTILQKAIQASLPTVENGVNKVLSIPGAQEQVGTSTAKILQDLKDYSAPAPM